MTTLKQQDDVIILAVEGELNHDTVGQFRQLATGAFADGAHDVVVDLAECTSVDSEALEVLTWLTRECEERLGMCKLCTLSDALEKIMEITRLDAKLGCCVTLDEAVASLS